ncbi:MAG: UDP-N-acetylmuramoyl-tripeptide--D-alanyl-D-alanine ligase [Flavobacteriaceae bacterium]|jgi:UDP-N-acetylmuramoyl-tripeptide--D-alanyl-D-alanine ligase
MNIQKIHQLFAKSNSVSIDTRNIKENDIFFAIKGPNFDGNKFAEEAIEKGCSYVISDNLHLRKLSDKIIYVKNSIETLQKLGNYHRRTLKAKIIAITGSNGKTTSKEILLNVLKYRYNTIATKGNLNNHLGVPLTLLSMDIDTEIGIIEMGANHLKEIETLCKIAEPDYGYITNFGNAHLEGFKTIEGVIKGKSELYEYLKSNSKLIFYNSQNNTQSNIIGEYTNSFSYGINANDDCQLTKVKSSDNIQVRYKNKTISSKIYGDYNFDNICIAIAIGDFYNIDFEDIKKGVENYLPDNNRSQITTKESNTIILDAYNANPTSMDLAIKSFEKLKYTNKIIIAGDMFELGEESNKYHQQIVNYLETTSNIEIFIVGVNFSKTNHTNKIKSFLTTEELITNLMKLKIKNYSILIKGSRGMELEKVIKYI